MKRGRFKKVIGFLFICLTFIFFNVDSQTKNRVIVLTDILDCSKFEKGCDPDDQQSLLRLLLYSDNIDIEGIISTVSHNNYNQDTEIIHKIINEYAIVFPNLLKHSTKFISPNTLHEAVASGVDGFGIEYALNSKLSNGATLIIEALKKDDSRPIWFSVWGDGAALGQAIHYLELHTNQSRFKEILSKIWVYDIGGQDDAGAWIKSNYSEVNYIRSRKQWSAISPLIASTYPGSDVGSFDCFKDKWIDENVQNDHGTYGNAYPDKIWMYEGDSPSFLYLINNGLGAPTKPWYGSWGGRFSENPVTNVTSVKSNISEMEKKYFPFEMFSEAKDHWNNVRNEYTALARWREDIQNDFAARMDWTIKSFENSNHPPKIKFKGLETNAFHFIEAVAGNTIKLDASGSTDPDGDKLEYRWWVYNEPGTYEGNMQINNSLSSKVDIKVPSDLGTDSIHLILEVSDNGNPVLKSYQRFIVTTGSVPLQIVSEAPPSVAYVDELYSYKLQLKGFDESSLDFELVSLPPWLSVTEKNVENGYIIFKGKPASQDTARYDVKINIVNEGDELLHAFEVEVLKMDDQSNVQDVNEDETSNDDENVEQSPFSPNTPDENEEDNESSFDNTYEKDTLMYFISKSEDDAEESQHGIVNISNKDLELVTDYHEDRGNQTVGLIFRNVKIPANKVIKRAFIRFAVDEIKNAQNDLQIQGLFTGHTKRFEMNNKNISSRLCTASKIKWQPEGWTQINTFKYSTDISKIINEIISNDGWMAYYTLGFVITGTGRLIAKSFEGASSPEERPILVLIFEESKNEESKNNQDKVNVYPNPTLDYFTVKVLNEKINSLTIYNLTGQMMAKKIFKNVKNAELNVSDLLAGSYLVTLQTDQGNIYRKILIKN